MKMIKIKRASKNKHKNLSEEYKTIKRKRI